MGRLNGCKITVQSSFDQISITETIKNTFFKAALWVLNEWQDNLNKGIGAEGFHTGAWKDTGRTINDITLSPNRPALEMTVGGDEISLAIAEYGRTPNSRMPPHTPISRWAKRKGLTPQEGQTWDSMVYQLRKVIAINGIRGFAPARLAAVRVQHKIDERFAQALDDHFEDVAKDQRTL